MTLLAYAYAMAQINGLETAEERDLYASYRERLTGSWFRRLDEDLVNQIERSVLADIHLPDADVALEYGHRAARLHPRPRRGPRGHGQRIRRGRGTVAQRVIDDARLEKVIATGRDPNPR